MASNPLRKLVEDVRSSGKQKTLSEEESAKFYSQFRKEMSPVVEEIREQEKRAHEEAKNITLA
ncbi:MAG: hypothetical protein ACYDHM_16190 [Acidiferrobacterales bacterium]